MAAISKNKYDVFNWVIKVYKSCTTYKQLGGAMKLRKRFDKIYSVDSNMALELNIVEKEKFNEIKD